MFDESCRYDREFPIRLRSVRQRHPLIGLLVSSRFMFISFILSFRRHR